MRYDVHYDYDGFCGAEFIAGEPKEFDFLEVKFKAIWQLTAKLDCGPLHGDWCTQRYLMPVRTLWLSDDTVFTLPPSSRHAAKDMVARFAQGRVGVLVNPDNAYFVAQDRLWTSKDSKLDALDLLRKAIKLKQLPKETASEIRVRGNQWGTFMAGLAGVAG